MYSSVIVFFFSFFSLLQVIKDKNDPKQESPLLNKILEMLESSKYAGTEKVSLFFILVISNMYCHVCDRIKLSFLAEICFIKIATCVFIYAG